MGHKKPENKLSIAPKVVGIINSPASLKAALRSRLETADFFEIRVDSLLGQEDKILTALPKLKLPLIITVRHPAEGGEQPIPTVRRRELFHKFLPHAAYIDVELRSLKSLRDVVDRAHDMHVGIIASFHNFQRTPPLAKLIQFQDVARKAGATILKIATVVSTAKEMAILLSLASPRQKLPLSLMGMGKYGKVSRLILAKAGSVLNYGFLDKPQVDGQWPAKLLKARIGEIEK